MESMKTRSTLSSCIRDDEGSVYIEYIVLVGMFALVIAGAILALGGPLLKMYQHLQLVWSGPFP